MKAYAGIGSRSTPPYVLERMTKTASTLDSLEYILRSGGAYGADAAFEKGVGSERKQIFLPWANFNHHPSDLHLGSTHLDEDQALTLAQQFHPAWDRCSSGARKLHARNCHQILGPTLDDPVKFVLCWTEGGKETGGTSQALRIAHHYDIYVCNLGAADGDDDLQLLLEELQADG